MKRLISLFLTVLMLCAMTPLAAVPASAEMLAKEETGLVENPLTAWMANVPDDAYLANLNIPATHDSGTAFMKNGAVEYFGAQTQTLPIEAQLNIGIRAFDIRYRCTENKELVLCHSSYDCYDYYWDGDEYKDTSNKLTLEKVTVRAAQYLADHPTETAILFVTREAGQDENDDYEDQGIARACEEADKILKNSSHSVIISNPSEKCIWYADNYATDGLVTGYEVKERENNFYNLTMEKARGNLIVVKTTL